jgi:hypothetical protein
MVCPPLQWEIVLRIIGLVSDFEVGIYPVFLIPTATFGPMGLTFQRSE